MTEKLEDDIEFTEKIDNKIESLILLLGDKDLSIVNEAIDALKKIELKEEEIESLIIALEKSKDFMILENIIDILKEKKKFFKKIIDSLIPWLEINDPMICLKAVLVFEKIKSKEVIDPLKALIKRLDDLALKNNNITESNTLLMAYIRANKLIQPPYKNKK
ncbi:hypothetical protein CVV26_00735 [Candidatus Kuenenbacteria bacterium HGW-Kuenenbacteria-1]|uniref:HEAT repeat domain-containing protein n=1 Tax=Candidatus Kuenenbacteria bacterium HGW-Kuenenbacteria-1 TaxID=2013812 RepID=A0A2N1UPE1_9BACT|nr:MAG: hypothetical protein CVV26_00735 [Candidatus Kuenenbacteria bacterium HGW-Kuenenbacteria-1]